ncbi:MAG TPA: hypothetical protein VI749_02230 [Candidatus Omnitrophota bacterium]|nr:hypothetical protein [Candidatus Omnitrophota bacterium]
MTQQLIKRLEQEGKLKKQKAGIVQIEALLKESMLDLKEAKQIVDIADRATYLLAYNAMLKAGRALLLWHGYRPDDGAQHKTVVELTAALLGDQFKTLTQHFESMRRKRNEMTYEAGTLLSKTEVRQSFDDAVTLVQEIYASVKAKDPQLKLNFDV